MALRGRPEGRVDTPELSCSLSASSAWSIWHDPGLYIDRSVFVFEVT
jgi:hypothetical protein